MAKRPDKSSLGSRPEWAAKIFHLRGQLDFSQEDLGQRLNCSAMAVSRWERGVQEPQSRIYIELGNLAGDPDCWYFWGRAGLRNEDVLRVIPMLRRRLHVNRLPDFEMVRAGSGVPTAESAAVQLVTIPLLKVVAASHGEKGDNAPLLHEAPVESMIAAPGDWCPNPADTSCLRVKGNSMRPLIYDGYIVVVDSSQTDRSTLNGKIVIAWHPDKGLTVSRLQRFDRTEMLMPENRDYEPVSLSRENGWKIIARVLWWIGKAP